MKGKIIKQISNQYVVYDGKRSYDCVAMGKLRKGKSPLVGDEVEFQALNDKYGIQKIYARKNQLQRPLIANVDQAIIVMSAKDPDFSDALLDRLLFQIQYAKIKPVICVTKLDLIEADDPIYEAIADYRSSGYEVYLSGKDFSTELIEACLKDKVSVLTGQSGAGKSSLINRIDDQLDLATQEISKALGRGKHTTRHSQLYPIAGGWLGDTPGFSSLDFSHMDVLDLAHSIMDFRIADGQCKFNDCKHLEEPECAVKRLVEAGKISSIRYQHYKEVAYAIMQEKKKY